MQQPNANAFGSLDTHNDPNHILTLSLDGLFGTWLCRRTENARLDCR